MTTDECILSVKEILQMLNLPFSLESVYIYIFKICYVKMLCYMTDDLTSNILGKAPFF